MNVKARWISRSACTVISVCLLLISCGKENENNVSVDSNLPEASSVNALTKSSGAAGSALTSPDITGARVLVFSKTSGWRHDSIPAGIAALKKLASENGFNVVATEDAALFTDAELGTFNAIVFLNTTLDVLDEVQQIAMERFIQAGGGFVGIHSAADTEWEGEWHWYRNLVGGVFKSHPNEPSNVQRAQIDVINAHHLATDKLPATFAMVDEWYDYRDLYPFRKDLLTVDEATYIGGLHGEYHPIAWYHDYDGGRSFYTGMGHTAEAFSEQFFLDHLLGGLKYAVGGKPKLDYSRSRPESNRFIKQTLVENLNEPMSFDFFPNGDALIAERPGTLKIVDYRTGETRAAGKIDVAFISRIEMGLIGIAIDPEFVQTSWVYAAFNSKDEQGNLVQRLARFKWQGDQLDSASQQILLEFHVDENCCHTGGDINFGHSGELFMSTGDNTNPHDQNGYAPIDFRSDKAKNDALRSAGNTQDLRGKILRIIPQGDGSYKIPQGNLFGDSNEGRPEIYVMGARNPFTITYDKASSTLFYADVGPDANLPSATQGPRAYDEINRVTRAGNFGWPLMIGNNQPYRDYDYAAEKSGRLFNPLAPFNNSPRNTGKKELPPAQPAMIWYPYAVSEEFPELGSGGRTALVADVYHEKNYRANLHRYPKYYDNKLFILDFMRTWVKVVSLDEFGRVLKIEPFAPHIDYALPIDARFAPDGTLYVLEYGMAWFSGNPDARLARIEFVGSGNRPPVPAISLAAARGAAPMRVVASASQSIDPDGDALTYRWSTELVGNSATRSIAGEGKQVQFDIAYAGVYILRLEAKDAHGSSASAETQIEVGNAPANIAIAVEGNSSFYWPETTSLNYAIEINDPEDGKISAGTGDTANVMVKFAFNATEPTAKSLGHQVASAALIGKDLVEANSCKACHQLDARSLGPSFTSVAMRYRNDPQAVTYLAQKIANGGAGAWGETAMPPFGHLNEDDRIALATYVLSLGASDKSGSLPLSGKLALNQHPLSQQIFNARELPTAAEQALFNENYSLSVSYTDKGGEVIGPLGVQQTLTLTSARIFLEELSNKEPMPKGFEWDKYQERTTLSAATSDKWLVAPLGKYDLTGIKSLQLGRWISKNAAAWEYEVRLGEPTGKVLAQGSSSNPILDSYARDYLAMEAITGNHMIYVAVRTTDKTDSKLHLLDLSFHQ